MSKKWSWKKITEYSFHELCWKLFVNHVTQIKGTKWTYFIWLFWNLTVVFLDNFQIVSSPGDEKASIWYWSWGLYRLSDIKVQGISIWILSLSWANICWWNRQWQSEQSEGNIFILDDEKSEKLFAQDFNNFCFHVTRTFFPTKPTKRFFRIWNGSYSIHNNKRHWNQGKFSASLIHNKKEIFVTTLWMETQLSSASKRED